MRAHAKNPSPARIPSARRLQGKLAGALASALRTIQPGFRLSALLLLAAMTAVNAAAQKTPLHPSFVLETDQAYSPAKRAELWIRFRDVSYLNFHVYRVKDPVKFFEQLKNPHQLGGPPAKIPEMPTPLERWHRWKRRLRLRIKNFFRFQFSYALRADWVRRHQRHFTALQVGIARYAQVHSLNGAQLALSWVEMLPRDRDWEQRVIPLRLQRPGLYLIEAQYGSLHANTILMITHLGLVMKSAPGQIVIYAAQRESGQPVSGAHIVLRPVQKWLAKMTMRGVTGSDGAVEFRLPSGAPQDWIALGTQGDEFAATDLPSWFFNSASTRSLVGYVYTERPVYRPGETVYYRGILRELYRAGYVLPRVHQTQVKFTDGSGKTLTIQTVAVSKLGTFSGSLILPQDSDLGDYTINISPVGITGDESVSGSAYFSVKDYKLPAYHVDVTPVEKRVLQGATESVNVVAKYYFGAPVPGAKYTWKLFRSRYWSAWAYQWSDDAGEDGGGDYDYEDGDALQQGQGRLDAQGRMSLTLPISVDSKQHNFRYRLVVGVTDLSNREIDGFGSFLATYSDDQVAVQGDQYFTQVGNVIHFGVRAATYENAPLAVPLTATDALYDWSTSGNPKRQVLSTTNLTTGPDGTAAFQLECTQAGSHEVNVTGLDVHGRQFSDETDFFCTGPAASGFREGASVTLKTDKKSYKPGDTANILVQLPAWKHPSPVWLWITTELDRVRTHSVLQVNGTTASFQVPVTAADIPNVMADVTFLRNGQLYTGEVRINVPASGSALSIQVQPGKPAYKPGDMASVAFLVRDADGKPVANADLGVGVVDDAIYSIAPDSSPDIFKYFYGYRSNQVIVQYSNDYGFEGWSGGHRLKLTRRPYFHASALGDVKPAAQASNPRVRKDFRPTAFWQGSVHTDKAGRAVVHFKLPDSLTSWRVTVRAVTAVTQVGSANAHFVTRKNLMLDLALPRFAVQGDQWTTYSVVRNYLPAAQQVRLTLRAKAVGQPAGALQVKATGAPRLSVASNQQARYGWKLTAQRAGTVNLLGQALGQADSDALQLPLPIEPNGIPVEQSYSGALLSSTSTALQWSPPAGALAGSSYLLVHLTPSLTGKALGALQQMIQYPYGCTEQTSSVMLSILAARDAVNSLHHPELAPDSVLLPRLRTGIERLVNSQNNDGGWGWWPDTPSDPYMSALAVEALSGAKSAGATVDATRIQQGHAYLIHLLNAHPRMIPDLQAPLLLAAQEAGGVDAALLNNLWDLRSRLSLQGRAEFVLLLAESGDSRATAALDSLLQSARQDALELWLPQRGDCWLGFGNLDDDDESDWFIDFDIDNSSLTTATALQAMLRLRPNDPAVDKAIRYLLDHSDDNWWMSTEQTAAVIQALAASLNRPAAAQEMAPNFTATLKVNGRLAGKYTFTAADIQAQQREIRIPLPDGPVQVSLSRQGPGVLYWDARLVSYSNADRFVHRGGFRLNVVRQYFLLQAVKTITEGGEPALGYRPVPLSGSPQVGDVLLVKLTVSGGKQSHLLIEDPLAAGVEPIENDALYPLLNKDGKVGQLWDDTDFYDWFGYSRVFRDDCVSFFQDQMQPGQHTYTYLARVIVPGSFEALPPRVQPMYDSSRLATGDRTHLTFREAQP